MPKYWSKIPRKLKKKLGNSKAKSLLIEHNSEVSHNTQRRAQRNMERMIGYRRYWGIDPYHSGPC